MSQRPSRRRSAPAVLWLVLGAAAMMVLICVSFGLLTWKQSEKILVLQTDLETTQDERQELETQLAELQSAKEDMENRLAALEGRDLDRQLASLQTATETASSPQEIADLRASLTGIQARLDHSQIVWRDLLGIPEAHPLPNGP